MRDLKSSLAAALLTLLAGLNGTGWQRARAALAEEQGPLLPTSLQNPSFDSGPVALGWTTHVYGAKAEIAADATVVHDGKQSLRISSTEPSDAALGQNLALPPGRVFRLKGWIKTLDLRSNEGVRVGGTLQIQSLDGSPRVSGRNHFGTNGWLEESIPFRVPEDGRVRVAVFFVGFGKGTGTAWFDGLRLEEVEQKDGETIRVTRERLRDAPISPFQCGQFVEFLCDLVPGMHAERLEDDSFEGIPPYRVKYLGEADRRPRPWRPQGDEDRGEWQLDRSNPFNGVVSQRIRTRGAEPCTLGVSQEGVYFDASQALRLRAWLRSEAAPGQDVEATARLTADRVVLAEGNLGNVKEKWARHEVRLVPTAASKNAALAIELHGAGTMWIDRVSLMPEDAAPGGWRPDVVKALKELHPAIIRLGGSATEGYEWESGIGDVDHRVPFTTCWGGLEPNRVGLEEFVTLCRLVDAEPLICARWTGKTPGDAANQVEYANGRTESVLGAKRAAGGHPEPYRVKYWQIGNEVAGSTYEETVAAFAGAMKKADPSIRVLSSFPSARILESAAPLIDYICPHHYACADLQGTEDDIARQGEMIARLGRGRSIRLAVTEWNTTAGDWGPGRGALLTLDNALKCARYHHLMHRHSDLIEIAIRSNLTNSFCSGIIQTRGAGLYLAPTYHAQKLYARAGGDIPMKIDSPLEPGLDELDLSATVSADGATLRLFAVNDSRRAIERRIDLEAFGGTARNARLFTVADRDGKGERSAVNSFEDPQKIKTTSSELEISPRGFSHTFPPLSIRLVEIELKQ